MEDMKGMTMESIQKEGKMQEVTPGQFKSLQSAAAHRSQNRNRGNQASGEGDTDGREGRLR